MRLKKIVIGLSVLGFGSLSATMASEVSTSQVAELQAQLNRLEAQVNAMGHAHVGVTQQGSSWVSLNPALAQEMMSTETGVGTEMSILKGRQSGAFSGSLMIGGQLKGYAQYERATYMEFELDHSDMKLANNTGLAILANVNPWVSAYIGIQGFGDQSSGFFYNEYAPDAQLNAPTAYLTIGNLNDSPIYGFVGRKDIDFGNFQSVSFYTRPLNQLFEMAGDTLGVGYDRSGFNGTVSVSNGGGTGPFIETGSNPGYTTNPHQINNFALNASYAKDQSGFDWSVGAGYVNGAMPKDLFPWDGSDAVGAWDVNAAFSMHHLRILGEFDRTAQPLIDDNYMDAWDLGASYLFPVWGKNTSVDADYSALRVAGYTFDQYVVGYQVETTQHVWVGVEYTYQEPLFEYLEISGSQNRIALVGTAYF
jgi:hypothetical protein